MAYAQTAYARTVYGNLSGGSSPAPAPTPSGRMLKADAAHLVASITPDETKDYALDWSAVIGSDSILSSAWTISPSTARIPGSYFSSQKTTVILTGGIVGHVYRVRNTIITASGNHYSKTVRLLVIANENF